MTGPAWPAAARRVTASAAARRVAASAAAALFVAAAALAGPAGPAWSIDSARGLPGHCPDATGVTVVVDFQELGGGTVVRCAPGDQATGYSALVGAGFRVTGTNRWGTAFVCRIEGRPGPEDEPCVDTPPATAYWSYWHAPNGGEWTYSQLGVAARKPPAGSFEGWSFAKDRTATAVPAPRVAPRRPAPPAIPSAAAPASAAPAGPAAPAATTAAGEAIRPPATGPGNRSAPARSAAPVSAPPGVGGSNPASPTVDTPAPSASLSYVDYAGGPARGGGAPVATMLGVAMVAAFSAAAGITVYRRSRRGSG